MGEDNTQPSYDPFTGYRLRVKGYALVNLNLFKNVIGIVDANNLYLNWNITGDIRLEEYKWEEESNPFSE